MLSTAARSLSRLALVACLLLVAMAVTPALAATTATDDSPAVEPTLVTALQLLTNEGVSAGQASALSVTGDANAAHWRTIGWEVDKSADVASQNVPIGGAATFNYTVSVAHDDGTPSWEVSGQLTVENPNSADVTDVVVSNAVDDPNATCVVLGDSSTIPANGSTVFDYSCSYSAAPASSSQTSTATISWPAQTLADSSSLAAGSASTSATVVWGDDPSILGGSGDVFDSLVGPLGSISYTDPSPVTFTYAYTFSDAPPGCASYDNTAVVGQEAAEFASDTASVEVCAGGSDLTVTKTASSSFTRTFAWSAQKSVDQLRQTVAPGASATFNYLVDVSKGAGVDSGWVVTGAITVSNANDWDVAADLTDSAPGGSCVLAQTSVTVPANDSVAVDYSCSFATGAAGTNTATASWDSDAAQTPNGSASATADYAFAQPSKLVNDSVQVYDNGDLLGPTDHSIQFSYPKSFPGTAGTCTTHDNTATVNNNQTLLATSNTVTVEVCAGGSDLTVTKTASSSFTRTFAWSAQKSVDQLRQTVAPGASATFNYLVDVSKGAGVDSGWVVTGAITVSNANDWDVAADLTDSAPGGSCVLAQTSVTVPANDSVAVDYSCSFATGAAGTNTATASWDSDAAQTPNGSASATADYAFAQPSKLVNDSVQVYDNGDLLGPTDHSIQFSYPKSFPGTAGTCTTHDNTATVNNNQTLLATSNTVTVEVCAGKDLTVSKTANASFTRTYKWTISKSVAAPTSVTMPTGSSATFNYSVNVASAGYADSGWVATGKITVANPNDWEAVRVNVTDAVNNGGVCTVTNGTGVLVPAGGAVTLDYSCAYASAPNPASGLNTATATWNSSTYSTPHGSATGTSGFAFGTPTTETNKTVTVTDTFNGSTTVLGTVTYPGPATYAYSRTVIAPATGCVTYPNTARISETGQFATASVQICGSAATGAHTIGFWQNKNGQDIIVAANQAQLLSFLKSYAPFSDASAPLKNYVTKIINAADASGAAMNAMLKAQMLATALDVFFSNPALGGNKLNAPAPIGGVSIDLTRVPPSGNTSSAFGGATSMTVSQILAYAAGKSNAGGSVWYGNVKPTQELAKNVFNAINNEWALRP